MKKRVCIYFLIFIMSVFYLSIPKVVFGDLSDAQQVFDRYKTLLEREDVQKLFPGFLRIFQKDNLQDLLSSGFIEIVLNNPVAYRTLDPDINNQFLLLLGTDDELRTLFRDPQFYIIFDDPVKIAEFAQLIEAGIPKRPALIEIVSGDNQSVDPDTSLKPFVVVVKNENMEVLPDVDVVFKVIVGDGDLSSSRGRTGSQGRAQTKLILGSDLGIYKVEAKVDGYPELKQTFTAATTAAVCPLPPEPTALEIVSGNPQRGESGKPLAKPFVVKVLDSARTPVHGIDVTFTVTAGDGTLWGRPIQTIATNEEGRAAITLMLNDERENEVEARVPGISLSRIFTATVTDRTESVVSDQLPPVYWVEGKAIYYLPPGDEAEAKPFWEPRSKSQWTPTGGLAIDIVGKKIYWTEENGELGRIRSVTLDRKKIVRIVAELNSVSYGITVGTDQRHKRWVYWTISVGNIQRKRIDVDGSPPKENFIEDLTNPTHITFDQEQHKLYWTETARIRVMSASGQGRKSQVAGNLGTLGGIAVANDRVYWTEKKGNEQQWKVKHSNGNGSSPKLLDVLESAPKGIAVDPEGDRAYWTTSHGEIQSVSLDREPVRTVVVGGNPAGIALVSESMGAPPNLAALSVSTGHPEPSTLLANYPNPFNPETWIPYQLSEARDVTVSIYSVNGQLVRRLDLGHQAAGVYRSRSRAAYWDGRNAFGERVASGLYFYTLTAGDFTATRKMLIRK